MTPGWTDVPVFGSAPDSVEAIARPSAYCVLADERGLVAVVRTPLGLYLPGGGMEPGESVAETVVREALEECGLESRVGDWVRRAIDTVYSPNDRCYFEKYSTFVDARCSEFRGAGIEPDHALEWMTPQDATKCLLHQSHRWAVEQWLAATRDDAARP